MWLVFADGERREFGGEIGARTFAKLRLLRRLEEYFQHWDYDECAWIAHALHLELPDDTFAQLQHALAFCALDQLQGLAAQLPDFFCRLTIRAPDGAAVFEINRTLYSCHTRPP